MARWTASAKWGEAPALADQCATLLGLALSEGLGFSEFGRVSGRTCAPSIVFLALHYCKRSRGTPRLRSVQGTLHGALRVASLWEIASTLPFCFPTDATEDCGGTELPANAPDVFAASRTLFGLRQLPPYSGCSPYVCRSCDHHRAGASAFAWLFSPRRQARILLKI